MQIVFSRHKVIQKIQRLTQYLTWPFMLALVLIHTISTYLLLYLSGETALIAEPITFLYYNMVVVSTVGFGDFSPVTDLGRLVIALWQIPLGLILFATFIGKTTQLFIDIARKNMNGSNDFSYLEDHILLLCWDEYSTKQVVQLILGDKKRKKRQILLCVTDDITNPLMDIPELLFAKLSTFSDQDELKRIALQKAQRIIIDGKTDDETLAIALSVSTFTNKEANITAHFFDETKAKLLKMHCPSIECSLDNSAKIMVRSMQDPGSSQVAEQLLSTLNGATLYSLVVPKLKQAIRFEELFNLCKQQHKMIVLGYSKSRGGNEMTLNPTQDERIDSHYHLHYISNERVDSHIIDWKTLSS